MNNEQMRLHAKNMRYKKAIVKDLNLEKITEELYEIVYACNDVEWYCLFDDDETLINALDGDEDEAYEFKMMFSDLAAESEQLLTDLRYEYVPDCFDDFFVAINGDRVGNGLLGWDSYEQDYYGISLWDGDARTESVKRLKRFNKDTLIDIAHLCFKIMYSYIGLKYRYDCLKASIDILREQNTGYLEMTRQIADLYEKANETGFYFADEHTRELDNLIAHMPQETWLQ